MRFKVATMFFFDYVVVALAIIGNRIPGVSNFNAAVLFVVSSITVFVINGLILWPNNKEGKG